MRPRTSTTPGRRRALAAALSAAALVGGAAAPARGDRVVTTDGGVLDVIGYETEGEWARLRLAGSGELLLPLTRIDRVVSDEPAGDEPATQVVAAPFDLRFRPGQPVPATPYGELIWDAAQRHGLNPALVVAMVRVESGFDPAAVSAKGARGLLQLMPGTAERFGIDAGRLFQPSANLEAGLRYLEFLAERYRGDLTRMLAAYNAGEVQVDRYGGVPPFRETREYVRRIARELGLG